MITKRYRDWKGASVIRVAALSAWMDRIRSLKVDNLVYMPIWVGLLGGVVKSAVIPARVGIRINLGPNTTLLVRILDSRLRGNDGNMQ